MAAYWVAHLSQLGLAWRPNDIVQWLPWIAGIAGLAAVGESLIGRQGGRWLVRIVAAASVAWILLRPLMLQGMPLAKQLAGLALIALAIVAMWANLSRLTAHRRGPLLPLSLAVVVVGSSLVLAMSGTAIMAQLSGPLIAALGVLFLLSWRYGDALELQSLAGPLSVILVAQWVIGLLYADMPKLSLLLLWLAPAALMLTQIPRLRRSGRVVAYVMHLALIALPLSGAVGLSALSYFKTSQPAAASPDKPATTAGPAGDDDAPDYDYDVE